MQQNSNTMPQDAETFRTWWVQKPMETAQRLRHDIMTTLQWDRNKWSRMMRGVTAFQQSDKIAIEKIAGERIWP